MSGLNKNCVVKVFWGNLCSLFWNDKCIYLWNEKHPPFSVFGLHLSSTSWESLGNQELQVSGPTFWWSQPSYQPTKQPTKQPNNQPTNQPTKQLQVTNFQSPKFLQPVLKRLALCFLQPSRYLGISCMEHPERCVDPCFTAKRRKCMQFSCKVSWYAYLERWTSGNVGGLGYRWNSFVFALLSNYVLMWIDSIAGVMTQKALNMPLIERFRSQAHSAMKLPGFIFPHVAFRFAAWIQDIMLIYHRMPILFLFENKIHTPICTRMSCSFLKVGAKASDNLTAVEVGSFSSKVLTTFVGPYSTRIWRWLVICRWERWPFWLLVIVMTLNNFFGRYFK